MTPLYTPRGQDYSSLPHDFILLETKNGKTRTLIACGSARTPHPIVMVNTKGASYDVTIYDKEHPFLRENPAAHEVATWLNLLNLTNRKIVSEQNPHWYEIAGGDCLPHKKGADSLDVVICYGALPVCAIIDDNIHPTNIWANSHYNSCPLLNFDHMQKTA